MSPCEEKKQAKTWLEGGHSLLYDSATLDASHWPSIPGSEHAVQERLAKPSKNRYLKDLPKAVVDQVWASFREALSRSRRPRSWASYYCSSRPVVPALRSEPRPHPGLPGPLVAGPAFETMVRVPGCPPHPTNSKATAIRALALARFIVHLPELGLPTTSSKLTLKR